jgi:ubiquinone/menaquinone biosynthesis C-methylase UbiE
MKILKKIDNFLFGRFQNHYSKMLKKEVGHCKSLLDVGCGFQSPISLFSKNIPVTVGIDMYEFAIERSRKAGIHNDYKLGNVLDLDAFFEEKTFECVLASDLIEHLAKEDGFKLLNMMEKIATKKVIIFTPNGFLPQNEFDNNSLQVHISGWEIEEMEKLGYRVTGINGYKKLRKEYADIRFKPKVFWGRISLLSQLVTTKKPKYAFGILCVKEF